MGNCCLIRNELKSEPFGPLPQWSWMVQDLAKVHTILIKCGDMASFTFRKTQFDQSIEIRSVDFYPAKIPDMSLKRPILINKRTNNRFTPPSKRLIPVWYL
jgi:uncharacterized protein (UPF0218 family)